VNKQIIDMLMRSLFSDIQHAGALERAALQRWINQGEQPTIQHISEYITERNWVAFLKHHMNVTDVQRMFRDRPENIKKFTNFIRSSFNLFVQEILLNKD
ncbi:14832_t:CDS:2, partial [Cetraspora pellucida]